MKGFCSFFFIIVIVSGIYSESLAQKAVVTDDLLNQKWIINDKIVKKSIGDLEKIHPNIYAEYSREQIDSVLRIERKTFPIDSIPETELLYEYRKIFDYFTKTDPHFRIVPQLVVKESRKVKMRNLKVLPFSALCINDTLLVDQSMCYDLRQGDIIISINGKNIENFIKYTYRDRYLSIPLMQAQNHYFFKNNYQIEVQRNGKVEKKILHGISIVDYEKELKKTNLSGAVIDGVGYFRIDKFVYNKWIVKKLRQFIKNMGKRKVNQVVLDLRHNTGGRGDQFDKLISLFTEKKELPYQKKAKLKVSKTILKDHSSLKGSEGKLIELRYPEVHRKISIKSNYYVKGMQYYILISKDTGSQAATFSNIIQYNELGKLVGEPLLKNALSFGEVITAGFRNSICFISTVEFDEHTKAGNGILKPDFEILYVAKDYMRGGDPILKKCIEYIKSNK